MVSQVTNIYADLYTWDNLYLAYRKAARGKRGRGPAARFEYRLEDNLIRLQDELAAERYSPGPYVNFTIHEPKRRRISAAPFRDRVVHHALCNIIEPAFERSFITHSYANRVGKGTHRALDQCQRWAKQYRFVLQCDRRQAGRPGVCRDPCHARCHSRREPSGRGNPDGRTHGVTCFRAVDSG